MNNFKCIKGLFAAIRFLTVLPVPGKIGVETDDLAGSLVWFPVVGLLIGLISGGLLYLVAPLMPASLAAVLAVALLAVFSGCLHLDGVADCGDGFFSSRPRERILEIMRDSHIGAMGVIAIFFVLAVKVSSLMVVSSGELWKIVCIMPVAGRAGIILMMNLLPYARPDGGLATVMYGRKRIEHLLWALALLFLAGWFIAGTTGLLAAADAMVLLLVLSYYVHLKIGGATGDTLGAACEFSEAAFAAIFVCL
ncbi:MAG: adenosylcobinamide-GDP ribazoletransferase [Proteobacteria bacterium]|nr:adenosylcobinamide-GDP ribazoletransferase [Pseudomonadota bacterium]MBU1739529.1 adenosylcobinamide-GDP ribazoletransferase [Pseudomonadota bacterium]